MALNCHKCGAEVADWSLKNGECMGCRNPEAVIPGVIEAKVKWFNDSKGYGFVEIASDPRPIFAHYSAIQGDGFKTLAEGETVHVEILDGPKGPQCTKIVRKA